MDGAQEVRAEDLDAHMQAAIEWAEQVNAKRPNQTLKRFNLKRRVFDAKHKPPIFHVGDKVWIYNSRKDT